MSHKIYVTAALMGLTLFCLVSCSKMNASYIGFLKGGEILYTGKIDSLNAYPGRDRIKLTWLLPADPKIDRVVVFWNDKADSLELSIPKPPREKAMEVMIDSLTDGSYSFQIYTYDSAGQTSVEVDTLVTAYGDVYQNSLLGRPAQSAIWENDTAFIAWYGPAKGAIGEQISYTDTAGVIRTLFSPVSEDTTVLLNYKRSAPFMFTTLYLPEITALDTFSTAVETQKVKGPPLDLDKTGWTATASSFDIRSGSNYRPPSNAIDNNPKTIWVNQIGTTFDYPHTITVDMGRVQEDIAGFSFIQRTPLNGALKDIELDVSQDSLTWNLVGDYSLANVGDEQFIDMLAPQSFRYFRMIGKNDYANSKNISLAEIGVYTR